MIESKSCGRNLKVLENGLLECSMDKGTASHFTVLKPNVGSNIVKFRNVAQPGFYLCIQNGYTIGYVREREMKGGGENMGSLLHTLTCSMKY